MIVDEQFRLMADAAPVLIWVSGADKGCYFFNAAWLSFRGRTMEQEYGDGWMEGIHPDDLDDCLETYHDSFDRRVAFKMEYRLKQHDGEYRWFVDNGAPRYTPAGDFVGYIGSCTDIEEVKCLKKRNDELERSNKELEEFAYTASHDMKEPIRKIIIFSDFILQDTSKTVHYATKVQEAAFRMNALIDNLLSLSSAGKETFTSVDLNEVLENVKFDLELLITQKGATITAPVLPVIIGIPQQLQQLFYNLISNSLKYAKADEAPRINITLEEEPSQNDFVKLNFADNGIGFAPQFADTIFNAFQRLHSRDKYPGSGIGLALCRKVVQNHSGLIHAMSGEGEGAVFTVLLPKK